jgi:hypothetical protein
MGLHRHAPTEAVALDELSLPERLAVWAFRSIDQDPRLCAGRQRPGLGGFVAELQMAVAQFQAFQLKMHQQGWSGLRVAEWGTLHLSRDERRLLRAVAAVQAGQAELADNLLFRFAPSAVVRPVLAQAVAALAATLAAFGHWLPPPARSWPLPAGALSVARMHGADLGELKIAWP